MVNFPSFDSSERDFMMRFDLAVCPGGEVLQDRACRRELLRILFSAHSM
ncbi:hypothetical protein BURMUCGD1_3988 [Burkholderia multivorans CGD1]|nr:hypothetical protein BURMUCGD1_3988 [Burkholderia multivorans CGD1]